MDDLSRIRQLLVEWNRARLALVHAAPGQATRDLWVALSNAEDELRKQAVAAEAHSGD